MATTLRQDIDFHGLFRKIGHSLEEIRVRALDNVLSKLEHKLICDADLVNERHLFIRLLEWFNFTSCPKSAEVLNLLNRLSQHSAAAEIIQDIGGIEFLTQFRQNVEAGLKPVVDQILENTMRLPDIKSSEHAPECIYHQPQGLHSTVTTVDESSRTHMMTGTSCSIQHASLTTSAPSAERLGCYGDNSPGYFTEVPNEKMSQQSPRTDTGFSSGFIVTVFPWLPLTPTDRHVLASTNGSLQSKEVNLLTSACEFLSDVVLQDFPAEIFLQRPQIVKSLLSLLNLPSDKGKHLATHAACTLTDLCECLRARMKYCQDPVLYTPKQDFSSSTPTAFSPSGTSSSQSVHSADTRPSVVGWSGARHRGDGRDGDSSASSNRTISGASSIAMEPDPGNLREETDADDSCSLQHLQLTLPQLCVNITQKALPLLRTSNEGVFVQVLHLLHQVLQILSEVISVEVWTDTSEAAREVVDKLTENLETASGLLEFHHHSILENPSGDGEHGDLDQHRLAYIGVCNYLTRMLKMIPTTKGSDVIPEKLLSSMSVVIFDESLANSYPLIRKTMLTFLKQLDHTSYHDYCEAVRVCQSFRQTCQFLGASREGFQTMSSTEITGVVEESILSLPYHLHLPLITDFVRFFSKTRYKSSTEQSVVKRCCSILLKFLSYALPQVRQNTYKVVLSTVQTCLNVNQASDPKSRACLRIRFLFEPDVLYEIVCFGLADSDNKVSNLAGDIIFHLLQGQLLMTETLWQEFTTALVKSLPILQSYTDATTALGRRIRGMLDPTSMSDNLSLLEKLRGTLRLMFSTDLRVRCECLKQLSWFISHETGSSNKIPVFSELDVTNLSNLFIMESPRSVDEDLGRSVFQVDGLKQVYGIFSSKPVDPGVKKSAADQLAIMLQDQNLHTAFRQEGGMEAILEMIRMGVQKDLQNEKQNDNIPYLPACVMILRHLLHHDYTLRHNLAHDSELYYCLLRVGLMFLKDNKTRYEVSHIMTLLLYDEIAKFDVSSGKGGKLGMTFTLPAVVTKRCRFPFRPSTHHNSSPNKVSLPSEDSHLLSGPPFDMLKLSWNLAWNSGMEELLGLSKISQNREVDEEFSPKLKLSQIEKRILGVTNLKWGFQQSVYSISNATSHGAVGSALVRLCSYLVVAQGLDSLELINSIEWNQVMGRFLQVNPTSTADESLLFEVLRFISMVLKLTSHIPEHIFQWLAEKLYNASGPLLGLLNRVSFGGETGEDVSESSVSVKRSLVKELLRIIVSFSSRLPYQLCRRLSIHQMRGDLSRRLMLRLNVTDAPHFYNLASLEGTLQCLMHITARPGWSHECSDLDSVSLCSKVLACLLEVVSAFHIGRGGTSLSYMGKGVTKAATLCLRHLAFEMAVITNDKDWPENWLYSRQGEDGIGEPGLNWMLTLWAYRDQEVRAAGLGIAVALTSTEVGRIMITSNCKHIPGGIWGAAFSILLDQSECSMVRQQAALLLVNLTSQTMPSGSVDAGQNSWQGPVVMDTEYEVSLVGLNALLALLHHSQFYQEMLLLLSNFHPQSIIHPVSVTMETQPMSTASSESTLSTSGSVSRAQSHARNSPSAGQLFVSASSSVAQQSTGSHMVGVGRHTPTTSASSSTPLSRFGAAAADASSTNTPGSADSPESSSVVTPCLISAVCQLLRNLVILAPQDTFLCLKRKSFIPAFACMIDSTLVQDYCKEMLTGQNPFQSELAFRDIIQMYESIVSLLKTCVVYDTPIRVEVLADKEGLQSIVSLLLIECDGNSDLTLECNKLWSSVLSFLTSLLQLQSSTALESLTSILCKGWTHLAETFSRILEMNCNDTKEVYLSCLTFLAVLSCEEGKHMSKHPDRILATTTLSELLDTPSGKATDDKEEVTRTTGSLLCKALIGRTTGSLLCKALIGSYDLVTLRSSDHPHSGERLAVVNTLKSLLAGCHSAKHTALEMGLAETLIEHVKDTHAKLNVESLQVGKQMGKKKENPLIQELVLTFDLLRNFMCQNEEVKMACYHSGLSLICHRLWAWCQVEPSLMISILSLLLTYTAHCPSAASSLAYTTATSSVTNMTGAKGQLSSNSLVHCLIKLTQKETERESGLLRTLFSLLATLTLSPECRNIMWKCNFFNDFSQLKPKKSKKSKQKVTIEVQWLELLTNLSFSTEGQQMILKISDSVNLLLDFIDLGSTRAQECAVLIIRNMCCHASNKQRLLANEKLIPFLLKSLEQDGEKMQAMSVSALWALIYNNQKARVIMKNANILHKLQEYLHNILNSGRKSEINTRCVEDLRSVISLVSD